MMKWMSNAALEYIGQAGLGYTFDALDEKRSSANRYSEAVQLFRFVSIICLPSELTDNFVFFCVLFIFLSTNEA